MKHLVPWNLKIILKIVLSRLPVNYSYWQRVNIFKHGAMASTAYALNVYKRHFDRVNFANKRKGYIALELGPGDSVMSSIIAYMYGANKCYMVDTGEFATKNMDVYNQSISEIAKLKIAERTIRHCNSFIELMDCYNGIYLVNGLSSLKQIPSQSVDFIWSQAVLEHVRVGVFDETLSELRRILKPSGMSSHRIDLKDHLSGGLNNLRFSSKLWESEFMAQSGFYTNRIRFQDMVERMQNVGFSVEVCNIDRWNKLPIPTNKLSKEFSDLDIQELLVSGFDVILH